MIDTRIPKKTFNFDQNANSNCKTFTCKRVGEVFCLKATCDLCRLKDSMVPTIVIGHTFCASRDILGFPISDAYQYSDINFLRVLKLHVSGESRS